MRYTARGIVVDKSTKNILLIKYIDKNSPSTIEFTEGFWVTPGGGVEKNESFKDALKREIFEETGIENVEIKNCIFSRIAYAKLNNIEQNMYYERYFLVETNEVTINNENITDGEREVIKEYKWWSVDELRHTKEKVFPIGFKNFIDMNIVSYKYPIDITDSTDILKVNDDNINH